MRIKSLTAILICGMALTGCSDNNENSNEDLEKVEETELASKESIDVLGDLKNYDDFQFVLELKRDEDDELINEGFVTGHYLNTENGVHISEGVIDYVAFSKPLSVDFEYVDNILTISNYLDENDIVEFKILTPTNNFEEFKDEYEKSLDLIGENKEHELIISSIYNVISSKEFMVDYAIENDVELKEPYPNADNISTIYGTLNNTIQPLNKKDTDESTEITYNYFSSDTNRPKELVQEYTYTSEDKKDVMQQNSFKFFTDYGAAMTDEDVAEFMEFVEDKILASDLSYKTENIDEHPRNDDGSALKLVKLLESNANIEHTYLHYSMTKYDPKFPTKVRGESIITQSRSGTYKAIFTTNGSYEQLENGFNITNGEYGYRSYEDGSSKPTINKNLSFDYVDNQFTTYGKDYESYSPRSEEVLFEIGGAGTLKKLKSSGYNLTEYGPLAKLEQNDRYAISNVQQGVNIYERLRLMVNEGITLDQYVEHGNGDEDIIFSYYDGNEEKVVKLIVRKGVIDNISETTIYTNSNGEWEDEHVENFIFN